jgi:hypothetical protein
MDAHAASWLVQITSIEAQFAGKDQPALVSAQKRDYYADPDDGHIERAHPPLPLSKAA